MNNLIVAIIPDINGVQAAVSKDFFPSFIWQICYNTGLSLLEQENAPTYTIRGSPTGGSIHRSSVTNYQNVALCCIGKVEICLLDLHHSFQ